MATNNLNDVLWSIPPIISDAAEPVNTNVIPGPETDGSLRVPLRQGVVCCVEMDRPWLLQNINQNEDDMIEFSLHGQPDGTWNQLNVSSGVLAQVPMFFLNRTDRDVIYMALFPQ